MRRDRFHRADVGQAALIVIVSTVVLTLSFVGLVSLLNGSVMGFEDRAPFYLLGMAIAFVVALFQLEARLREGIRILAGTIGIAILAFVLIALGGEGLLFAFTHPDRLISRNLIVYFLAAALICTGIGYWGLRHWREFTDPY